MMGSIFSYQFAMSMKTWRNSRFSKCFPCDCSENHFRFWVRVEL